MEGISNVRVRPLLLDVADAAPAGPAGLLEVTWQSTHAAFWHQVYVNGAFSGVTARAADRRLVVAGPVGRSGGLGLVWVDVVAVDAADRRTDFAEEVGAASGSRGGRVRLTWQAGTYLDEGLAAFDVYTNGGGGAVDYALPLNEMPLPATPGGAAPWGYGCGGFGVGGYGVSAAAYEWTTDHLGPGEWRFAVVGVDAAGNRLAVAAEIALDVTPASRPAGNVRLAGYDPGTSVATIAWDASPDV
jgi:hypothetical protein